MNLLTNFLAVFMESAPWLLLGLLVAGLIKALVPADFMARHLGQPGRWAALKAAVLGAPLPLCSCGVVPVAVSLRRAGASRSATTSFLIATPETGVDSIAVSYALLGPFMAIIRPIAALASALTAGFWVAARYEQADQAANADQTITAKSCCAKTTEVQSSVNTVTTNNTVATNSCCASEAMAAVDSADQGTIDQCAPDQGISNSCCDSIQANKPQQSWLQAAIAGWRFSFVDLLNDISGWLLIGLLFAAMIRTFVPMEFLAQWGDGLLAFVVMALIGVPMYICATASTPIAAGLLFSGVSPGAVLVFLLVGPATNIATMGVVKQELGKSVLMVYLVSVVLVGFAFGFFTNYLAELWQLNMLVQAEHAHELLAESVVYTSSFLLAVMILWAWFKKRSNC